MIPVPLADNFTFQTYVKTSICVSQSQSLCSNLSQFPECFAQGDMETAHVMLYVTPLRGISFDVGAFRRHSTMLTASIYRTTGSHYRRVEYSHFELYTWIPRKTAQ